MINLDINYDANVAMTVEAQKALIIKMLKENKETGVTTKDFKARNIHHTDRISKLRKDGYVIDCIKIDSGNYRYVLVSEGTGESNNTTSVDMFINGWNSANPNNKISKRNVEAVLALTSLNIVTKKGGFKKNA